MANLYIISGCNGAGKTTASYTVLPDMLDCKEFVNADEIAKGLSPFQPEKVAIEAGRIMLGRIKGLIDQGADFAFETTLASKSYFRFIIDAQEKDYFVTLIYFWLNSPELALKRVKERVELGGHDIPEETVRRRYKSGMDNLLRLYIPVCDYWLITDNSEPPSEVIASGYKNGKTNICNRRRYNKIIGHDTV